MKLYHNPACSKSRKTLEILEGTKLSIDKVLYLENPPSAEELQTILNKLGMSPRQLLRRGEKIYSELELDNQDLSSDAIIAAMVAHPILIERPIFVVGDRAVIGRPPESVLTLLDG